MRTLIFFSSLCMLTNHALFGSGNVSPKEEIAEAPFHAFTGRVSKDKVRMRLQPNLDCQVVRELKRGDLLVIVGETEEFYAVQPPSDIKGYVYRTLVLDNVIEGSRVNVRLEPLLDAPVIAQLNQGEHVQGHVAAVNSKWLEIDPPAAVHFFVSRDFVENIGDAQLIATLQRRQGEVNALMAEAQRRGQSELTKPFEAIDMQEALACYRQVIENYSDFPQEAHEAQGALKALLDNYLQYKLAFLEEQQAKNELLQKASVATVLSAATIQEVEMPKPQGVKVKEPSVAPTQTVERERPLLTAKMANWLPKEQALFSAWCRQNGVCSQEEWYKHQHRETVILKGLLEPYSRNVKNKPGDYLLFNAHHVPVACLYSTSVDLHSFIGQQVELQVIQRPNNHFAFPAYYVLEVAINEPPSPLMVR